MAYHYQLHKLQGCIDARKADARHQQKKREALGVERFTFASV